LFAELESEQLAELVCRVRKLDFAAEQTIFQREDPGEFLFVVHQGRVRIELDTGSGPPVILAILGPGEFFGELALCDGRPRSATAVAMEPTQALALRRDDFLEFLRVSPQAGIHILEVLADRLRQTGERLSESIFYDTASRLARRLLRLAASDGTPAVRGITLSKEITPEELAELVGSTTERIEHELDGLEQDQILARSGNRITVLSPALLKERIHRKSGVGPGSVTIPTWLLD
jgi:CRP/FNR family transcriptional regulator